VRRRAYAASQQPPKAWTAYQRHHGSPTYEEVQAVAQMLFDKCQDNLFGLALGYGVACMDARRWYEEGTDW